IQRSPGARALCNDNERFYPQRRGLGEKKKAIKLNKRTLYPTNLSARPSVHNASSYYYSSTTHSPLAATSPKNFSKSNLGSSGSLTTPEAGAFFSRQASLARAISSSLRWYSWAASWAAF